MVFQKFQALLKFQGFSRISRISRICRHPEIVKSLQNVGGFRRETLRSSLALSSVSVQFVEHSSGKRWDGSDLGHVAPKCFGTKWYSDVPGARSTRDGDTGSEYDSSFAASSNLTNKLCVQLCHDKRLCD